MKLHEARTFAEYQKFIERHIVSINVACRCKDCRHEIEIRHAGILDANRNRCAVIETPSAMTWWRHDWRACPKYEKKL